VSDCLMELDTNPGNVFASEFVPKIFTGSLTPLFLFSIFSYGLFCSFDLSKVREDGIAHSFFRPHLPYKFCLRLESSFLLASLERFPSVPELSPL